MKPAEYERMRAAEDNQWWYAGMRAISSAVLDRELPRGARHRVADAGCGTGGNLDLLARFGWVVGVDLAEEALSRARVRGIPLLQAELGALPFADASLDCVTSFDVLYHRWVRDDQAAVAEMARVLRPGGLVFVRVPALELLRGAHDEEVLTRHRYTRDEVERLLTGCGLVVLRSTYCNSLLFPVLVLRRVVDRVFGRHGSDVTFLPAPMEWLFRRVLGLEASWLARRSFPIGSSVIALGRKPPDSRVALRVPGNRGQAGGSAAGRRNG